jgi:hypothetical protein
LRRAERVKTDGRNRVSRHHIGKGQAAGTANDIYIWQGLLAQLQDKAGAIDDAPALIVEGLALVEKSGGHRADSFLRWVRGRILAERDPAAAEAVYREALPIAQTQGACTYELQAAGGLAALLNRAGRPAEVEAVLEPTLKGFSPTPDMPEIAEAQALMERLAWGRFGRDIAPTGCVGKDLSPYFGDIPTRAPSYTAR